MKQVKTLTSKKQKSSLESSLLDMEERAVLLEMDQPENSSSSGRKKKKATYGSCQRNCYMVCCDIGTISIVATLAILMTGVILLVLVRALDLPAWVDQLARYIISAGVFGLATGGTNAIALLMLLYKMPLICGSGVFYRRHHQVKGVFRMIVLQLLFSSEHLQNYLSKKIKQFTSHVQVTESINQTLQSPEMAQIIEQRLDILYAEPEAQFFEALGLNRHQLEPMIRPIVLSLCAETAPYVLDNKQQSQFDRPKAVSVPRFRKEMDDYLTWRVEELTEKHIGQLMRELMYQHLGWVVVWGCIFGALSGIVTQGVRISLNFNFFQQ